MKHASEKSAKLVEIFSSFQGEGLFLGQKMTFVRFEGCALKCRFCDTPESFLKRSHFRIETSPFSNEWALKPNPISKLELSELILPFNDPWLSLTGGEPLEQVDFLLDWLPMVFKTHRVLVETSGVLPEALGQIVDYIDTVSMDFKLPSSANTGTFWDSHKRFLEIAGKVKHLYVKIVLTGDTKMEDLEVGLDLLKNYNKAIPLFLQPVSETKSFRKKLPTSKLSEFYVVSASQGFDVRVVPQMHKMLGIA